MSRKPRGRRDPVGDRVADSYLPQDLEFVRQVLRPDDRAMLDLLVLDGPDTDHAQDAKLIMSLTGRIRADPALCAPLLAYLGDRVPRGICLWCGRELKPREPGKSGRPAKYCDPAHRQRGCRARKRQSNLRASE